MGKQQPILDQFAHLTIWRQGDQRAPHKPLTILYALGRWQHSIKAFSFRDVESDLRQLLQEFGPPRRSDHPEQPFWRLQNDGVWQVQTPYPLTMKKRDDIPTITALRTEGVLASFPPDVQAAFQADPQLVPAIAAQLLEQHFPTSLHQDILAAVGIESTANTTPSNQRDPTFRTRILRAYEWRCAVCGFDVRLGSMSVALDAAHIKWHQAGGPCGETNGLALCVLHHKLFDLGTWGIEPMGTILVSEEAHGSVGFDTTLMVFHGQAIRRPQHPDWYPHAQYLDWHRREVFKGRPRHRV